MALHSGALCFNIAAASAALTSNPRDALGSWGNRISTSGFCRLSTVKASPFSSPPPLFPSIPPFRFQGKALAGDNGSSVANDSSLVVCFGEIGLSLAESAAFKKAPGGAPANVAVGISRLGGSSAFIGKTSVEDGQIREFIEKSYMVASQVQSHENQMNPQWQPIKLHNSVKSVQLNNVTNVQNNSLFSLSASPALQQNMMNSLQPISNLDLGQGASLTGTTLQSASTPFCCSISLNTRALAPLCLGILRRSVLVFSHLRMLEIVDIKRQVVHQLSVSEQPRERLVEVVKSMSQKASSASVSDIGSVMAGSAPGNESRAAIGEGLVAMMKCRLQARNFVTILGKRKIRHYTSTMPLNVVSSVGLAGLTNIPNIGPVKRAQELAAKMGFHQDPEFVPLINMFLGQLTTDFAIQQKSFKAPLRLDALGRESWDLYSHGKPDPVCKRVKRSRVAQPILIICVDLGKRVRLDHRVAEDEFGYMLADILKENNVNHEGMRFDPGARTA
ncbi:LOW QUALITY PROTEIN: Carbohydrate kinase PfkB [Dillenia turbinata]|uniref:Carbohydrate kinase PfkB n=1 Tax=Dillenia turbinata TaxID=194707 RepID=A0AAN8V6X2_9MAGN